MANTGYVGSIEEFDSTAENITAYLQRLEMYIVANVIAEGKKVSVLLTVIGAKKCHLLRNLLSPNLPQEELWESCRQTKISFQSKTTSNFR